MTERVTIIGGGLTGLFSAAALARSGYAVTLISEHTGGLISQLHKNGFNIDFGVHVYTPSYNPLTALFRRIPGAVYHERRVALYRQDRAPQQSKMIPYPVQSFADLLGIQVVSGKLPRQKTPTLENWAIAEFGQQFYDEWYRPFNQRVWGADPKDMASDWVRTRVTPASAALMKDRWGPNSSFWYATGSEIISLLIKDLTELGVEIVYGRAVVDPLAHGAKVIRTSTGRAINYDWLVSTMPINHLLRFMRIPGLDNVKTNMVITVGLGLRRKIEQEFTWYYNDVGKFAHRVSLTSRLSPFVAPEGKDLVIVEIPIGDEKKAPWWIGQLLDEASGYPYPTMNLDYELILEVMKDAGLGELFSLDDVEVAIGVLFPGYPTPILGLRENIYRIKKWLLTSNLLSAGRFGSHAYFNMDHCMMEADAVVNQIERGQRLTDEYARSTFYYGQ